MDLLLNRYNDMDFIMNLDIDDFIGLIERAIEKQRDENFFAVWKGLVPLMTDENFVSFDEYKNQLLRTNSVGRNVSGGGVQLTEDELIDDAENIIGMLERK